MKDRWCRTPRVGTKRNEVFRALLRGLSSRDVRNWGSPRNVHDTIRVLVNECGFDVRVFTGQPDGRHTGTKGSPIRPNIYKIVGRVKWNGDYVSFTERYANE